MHKYDKRKEQDKHRREHARNSESNSLKDYTMTIYYTEKNGKISVLICSSIESG